MVLNSGAGLRAGQDRDEFVPTMPVYATCAGPKSVKKILKIYNNRKYLKTIKNMKIELLNKYPI